MALKISLQQENIFQSIKFQLKKKKEIEMESL